MNSAAATVLVTIAYLCAAASAQNAAPELLPVAEHGQAGFIDHTGKIVIASKFSDVGGFSEGLAAAWVPVPEWAFPLAGFIDASGQWVIKPQFDKVGSFHEGLARAELMDRLGTWAFVSRSGAIIKVPAQEVTPVSMALRDVSEGLAAFSPTGDAFGFMRTDGSLAVAPTYRSVRDYHGGLANVCNDKCGFIDRRGTIVVPLIYSAAGDFTNGRARVCDATKCGYVDKMAAFSSSPNVFLIGEGFWQHIVEANPDGLHAFCPEALCGYIDDRQRVAINPRFSSPCLKSLPPRNVSA